MVEVIGKTECKPFIAGPTMMMDMQVDDDERFSHRAGYVTIIPFNEFKDLAQSTRERLSSPKDADLIQFAKSQGCIFTNCATTAPVHSVMMSGDALQKQGVCVSEEPLNAARIMSPTDIADMKARHGEEFLTLASEAESWISHQDRGSEYLELLKHAAGTDEDRYNASIIALKDGFGLPSKYFLKSLGLSGVTPVKIARDQTVKSVLDGRLGDAPGELADMIISMKGASDYLQLKYDDEDMMKQEMKACNSLPEIVSFIRAEAKAHGDAIGAGLERFSELLRLMMHGISSDHKIEIEELLIGTIQVYFSNEAVLLQALSTLQLLAPVSASSKEELRYAFEDEDDPDLQQILHEIFQI